MSLAIDVDTVLNRVSQHLREAIVPTLDGYNAYYVGIAATIVECAALEYNSAAQVRAEENCALRGLLTKATPFASKDLAARLQSALDEQNATDSILISDLTRINRMLRALLIDVHAEVEQRLNEDWAADLNAEIIKEYRAMSERYQFDKLLSTY
ncbi:MAG: hypothetical protein ACK5JM_15180 [Rhodoblastus sp.]